MVDIHHYEKNAEMGWFKNVLAGVIGGAVGKFILGFMGYAKKDTWVASVLVAVLGACVFIAILNIIQGRKER